MFFNQGSCFRLLLDKMKDVCLLVIVFHLLLSFVLVILAVPHQGHSLWIWIYLQNNTVWLFLCLVFTSPIVLQ